METSLTLPTFSPFTTLASQPLTPVADQVGLVGVGGLSSLSSTSTCHEDGASFCLKDGINRSNNHLSTHHLDTEIESSEEPLPERSSKKRLELPSSPVLRESLEGKVSEKSRQMKRL